MPRSAVKLIEVGEASGSLDAMLEEVARDFEERLDRRLARTMSLLEPALILVTGALIGTVIVVMYLPILRLAAVIR